MDQVKVVILGQDPYHGPGQAHGLCFSVPEEVKIPPSLVNIFKEIKHELEIENTSGNLQGWAEQGVLLLNSVLTVEMAQAASHQGKGWEQFTDKVISMNDKVNKAKKLKEFKNFKVTSRVMSYAKKDAIFLHCLPRGSEVSNEVFLGKQSRVWQQALNRIYVQKSILLYCFEKLR